jgi:hypothetical protein
VVDVVADEGGRVAYVLVGAGDGLVAVPWGAVRSSAEGRAFTVTAQVTRARLRDVSFAADRYPDFASETWLRGVRAVWGEQALQARPVPAAPEGVRPAPRPTGRAPADKQPPPERPGRPFEKR